MNIVQMNNFFERCTVTKKKSKGWVCYCVKNNFEVWCKSKKAASAQARHYFVQCFNDIVPAFLKVSGELVSHRVGVQR